MSLPIVRRVTASIASSTAIDLSRLPAPDIIEQLDYEGVRASLLADLIALYPAFSALVESDPLIKAVEMFAYRELILRSTFNARARGAMVAYATGADLDNLAALFGVTRLEIAPADGEAGTPAVMESDDALRTRTLLAPDSFTVAGPVLAYVYHALSASGEVLDASATSPAPGEVVVALLAQPSEENPSGIASPELVALVEAALSADTVRPLTDLVTVQSASITDFAIVAELTLYAGPDANLILATAQASLTAWLAANRRLGRDVPRSALMAALHVAGVQKVDLIEPAVDLVFDATEAGYAETVAVTIAGTGE